MRAPYLERLKRAAIAVFIGGKPKDPSGETPEQHAFRDGFNEGHVQGMDDQADHFVSENARLRDVETIVSAIVMKAGGRVPLSERELIDAHGLRLHFTYVMATGERVYTTVPRAQEQGAAVTAQPPDPAPGDFVIQISREDHALLVKLANDMITGVSRDTVFTDSLRLARKLNDVLAGQKASDGSS